MARLALLPARDTKGGYSTRSRWASTGRRLGFGFALWVVMLASQTPVGTGMRTSSVAGWQHPERLNSFPMTATTVGSKRVGIPINPLLPREKATQDFPKGHRSSNGLPRLGHQPGLRFG